MAARSCLVRAARPLPRELLRYWRGPDLLLSGLRGHRIPHSLAPTWAAVTHITLLGDVDRTFLLSNLNRTLFPAVRTVRMVHVPCFEWVRYSLDPHTVWRFARCTPARFWDQAEVRHSLRNGAIVEPNAFDAADVVLPEGQGARSDYATVNLGPEVGWARRAWYEHHLQLLVTDPTLAAERGEA
jgi:hypothetical protein